MVIIVRYNLLMNIAKRKGFTLVEVLVTVAIVIILTAIILAALDAIRAKGRDARRISDIKQIQGAIENYFSSCYRFPSQLSDLEASAGCPNYTPALSSLPEDIQSGGEYRYYVTSEAGVAQRYHLCAVLEYSYGSNKGKAAMGKFADEDQCDADPEGENPDADKIFDAVGGAI
jgi:prepilin-type N-terminal cleavage/methylation domain-containing protein